MTKGVFLFENNVKQNRFLKNCLSEALLELMSKKPFQKISVIELCRKAGVSRMAYYRNYASKDEILQDYIDQAFLEYLSVLSKINSPDLYDVSNAFFTAFGEDNAAFLDRLIESDMSGLLLNKFSAYLDEIFNNITLPFHHSADPFERSFIAGGLYNVLMEWVAGGRVQSTREMSLLITMMFS